jgi:hypothetical protein
MPPLLHMFRNHNTSTPVALQATAAINIQATTAVTTTAMTR